MVIFNSYVCLPDRTILIWWFDVPGTLGSANKIGRLGKQPLFLGVIQITSENMSCEDKPNMELVISSAIFESDIQNGNIQLIW